MGAAAAQLDLLDWAPPAPVSAYRPQEVRAATLSARCAKAVAATLRDHKDSRAAVARGMSAYLGRQISVNALNAYASEARTDHVMNVVVLQGLLAVTGDRRLLQLMAEPIGCVVVERRWLRLIELSAIEERSAELARHASALRRAARAEGSL